ncbi:hypothetical protein BC629DRAFT_1717502 [Irpex lacteus]|nr:hypothetical protein BC629DRAFT_1717502 [Irpex lacteus]
MSNLEKTLFQLKFTAKTLSRQAKKAQKDENTEKARLKKALQQGNNDGARIYAANAIRKKNEALNLLRLSSRVDAVASRVETAVTMRQMTGNMASVVKGMDKAMDSMNLERVQAMSNTTAVSTPQDEVDALMKQTAEEANIELEHETIGEEDDKLAARLRALRPAT